MFLLVLSISLSLALRHTPYVWVSTRVFGLLAYAGLFVALLLGELRMLLKEHGGFPLFKYHKPTAIFSLSLVVLHFITAVADKFKWGKSLVFTQYLGFSFSNKWLVFISLGTLAAYLMILISITSSTKIIQKMGFSRWKIGHYISYAIFVMAYVHTVYLGTDIKTSFLSPYLHPAVTLSFFVVAGLFVVRVLSVKKVFSDVVEKHLAASFIILLLAGSVIAASEFKVKQEKIGQITENITGYNGQILESQGKVDQLSQQIVQMESAKNSTLDATASLEELKAQVKIYEVKIAQLSKQIEDMKGEVRRINVQPPREEENKKEAQSSQTQPSQQIQPSIPSPAPIPNPSPTVTPSPSPPKEIPPPRYYEDRREYGDREEYEDEWEDD